jgi:hypothetical protein
VSACEVSINVEDRKSGVKTCQSTVIAQEKSNVQVRLFRAEDVVAQIEF